MQLNRKIVAPVKGTEKFDAECCDPNVTLLQYHHTEELCTAIAQADNIPNSTEVSALQFKY